MNIIYIHSHDTGRMVAPLYPQAPTPNIAAFSSRMTCFTQAFCASPTCSPSRAALLTGQYPHENGMIGLAHRGFQLTYPHHHLAHFLAKYGYETALSGIQHEVKDRGSNLEAELGYKMNLWDPKQNSFPQKIAHNDNWRRIGDHISAHAAMDYLRNPPQNPFFLSVGFWNAHRGLPSALEPVIPDLLAGLPDCPETRKDSSQFWEAVRQLDVSVGEVLRALYESKAAENTMVILTTDHGPAFPRMKCNLSGDGLGVLLFIDYPGNPERGKNISSMVSQMDLFPTICELAGLPKPDWLRGRSLMPLFRGECNEIHEAVFGETNFHAAYEPARSVRTPHFNYIRRYFSGGFPLVNTDISLSRDVFEKSGYYADSVEQEEFYDIDSDPLESRNLINVPSMQQALQTHRKMLDEWMVETMDPLREGEILAPPNARIAM